MVETLDASEKSKSGKKNTCKAIPSHKTDTRSVRGPVMHGTADQRAIARRHEFTTNSMKLDKHS